jgi:hypothetical protein
VLCVMPLCFSIVGIMNRGQAGKQRSCELVSKMQPDGVAGFIPVESIYFKIEKDEQMHNLILNRSSC